MNKKGILIAATVLVLAFLVLIVVAIYQDSQKTPASQKQDNQQNQSQTDESKNNNQEKEKNQPQKEDQSPVGEAPKAENLKSLDGVVKQTKENSLTVEFQYEDTTWQSKVNITEETFVGQPPEDDNSGPKEINLQEIQPNTTVIISSQDNIFNKETFDASGVMAVN
jgi:cytoskeletal protein RodZ